MCFELVSKLCVYQHNWALQNSKGQLYIMPSPLLDGSLVSSFFSMLEIWFMDLSACFQGRLAHSDPVHLAAMSKSAQQWFSRPMACFSEYHISCYTGAENLLWGEWREVASSGHGGQKLLVILYRQLWKWFWKIEWAASTSLGFWWSRIIKQASQYLGYIQSSFPCIVY